MNNIERWRVKVEGTILRGLKDGATTNNIAECIVESILEEAISAVKNDTECKGKWISVDERLPEKYGDYLVAVKTKKLWETEWEHGVSVACFVISEIPNVNGWHIEIEDGYQYEITHWMPLPEDPKMKGGAE